MTIYTQLMYTSLEITLLQNQKNVIDTERQTVSFINLHSSATYILI